MIVTECEAVGVTIWTLRQQANRRALANGNMRYILARHGGCAECVFSPT
jgi:hypothetical protein